MKASFIIPTLNAENTVELCLESVLAQKPYEIIIVDSNSTDQTLTILKNKYRHRKEIKVLTAPNPFTNRSDTRAHLKVYAFNMGLKAASGDIIVLVNQDIVLEESWWQKIRKHYNDKSVVLVGGRLIHVGNDLSWIYNSEIETGFTDVIAYSGHAYSFRRQAALAVGGFDGHMWRDVKNPIEDADLTIKLLERGRQFIDGNAVAVHLHPIKDSKDLIKKSIDLGHNRAIFSFVAAEKGFFPLRIVKEVLLTVSFFGLWLKTYVFFSRFAKEYSQIYQPRTPILLLSLYAVVRSWILMLSRVYFLFFEMARHIFKINK